MKPSNRIAAASLFAAVAMLAGCASTGPHVRSNSSMLATSSVPKGDSVTTFFALGDWGTGKQQQMDVAALFEAQLNALEPERAAAPFVLGLGDNVYEDGLLAGWDNPTTEDLLHKTFGKPYGHLAWDGDPVVFHMVAGNHDYAAGLTTSKRDAGWGDVAHQEATAEGLYEGWRFYALDYPGKPDSNDEAEYNHILERAQGQIHPFPESMTLPVEIELDPAVPVGVFGIDSQAMLERIREPRDGSNDRSFATLDSLLAASDKPWKMVITHHPIDTYSAHGQHRTLDNWLWTGSGGRVANKFNGPRMTLLTFGIFTGALIHPAGWIIAGLGLAAPALSVIGDKIVKHRQDTDHWAYKEFATTLDSVLTRHNAIAVSGHDHSLQLMKLSSETIQIISGSAGKKSWVASSGENLHYAAGKGGFARFDATEYSLFVQFCETDGGNDRGRCGAVFDLSHAPGAFARSR